MANYNRLQHTEVVEAFLEARLLCVQIRPRRKSIQKQEVEDLRLD